MRRSERIEARRLESRFCGVEFLMRRNWTPSIVPESGDQNIYLVMDDLGRLGRVWPEADAEATDLETVITDLLTGQYKNPVRVVAFNTAERWSEDISEDVAEEIAAVAIYRCAIFPPRSLILWNGTKAVIGANRLATAMHTRAGVRPCSTTVTPQKLPKSVLHLCPPDVTN
jgi:hypothetical protein